jgi:hypothetical protein
MTPLDTAARHYDAWQNKQDDLSEVPLADDFEFVGPVASGPNCCCTATGFSVSERVEH